MQNQPQELNKPDERAGLPSASSFDRVVHCPGSIMAEANFGVNEETAVALSGTRIHDALEDGDDSELEVDEAKIKEALDAMAKKAITEWLAEVQGDEILLEEREVRYWVNHPVTYAPLTSGRLDYLVVSKQGRAAVIDFKTGFKDATASETNWQLRVNSVAVWRHHRELKSIRVAIAQSRLGSRFDATDYAVADLERSYNDIVLFSERAQDQFAPRVPGAWCRYCKARGVCPEAATWALMPSATKVPQGATKDEIPAIVERMTPTDMAFVFSRMGLAEEFFKAIKARLKAMSADELLAIGLKTKKSGSVRSVTDILGAFGILEGEGLITREKFLALCKVNIGALEKELVKPLAAKNGVKQERAKEQLGEMLAPVIAFKEKADSLEIIK